MNPLALSRRGALAAGLSLTFAGRLHAASGADLARRRLVVIVCRGGMDGLSVAPPIGDASYQALRQSIAIAPDQALKLDGDFGLHPRLSTIHALAMKGQARIAPAIASPDRARSHFEAQDVLESGASVVYGTASGWLNRTLQAASAGRRLEALAVGAQTPLILRGPVQAASWSPGASPRGDRIQQILADLYVGDPLLSRALASGLETEAMAQTAAAGMTPANGRNMAAGPGRAGLENARQMGATVANFMTAEDGPQIVALSVDGFDTHANQGGVDGALAQRLASLDSLVEGLVGGLKGAWTDTAVVVVTEFGRTARINGTRGTDHGTASTALVLGGGLKPGGLIGDWPGLAQGRLFEGRDLAPTLDMRALFKGLLQDHMGLDRRVLDRDIFPDSSSLAPITGLV